MNSLFMLKIISILIFALFFSFFFHFHPIFIHLLSTYLSCFQAFDLFVIFSLKDMNSTTKVNKQLFHI